jgi:hypothetical protein
LILAVANFRHNLVYRVRDRVGSLFRNPMIAILNDNLFTIRGKASQLGLQLMDPGLVKLRDFFGSYWIDGFPILPGGENDQWAIT